MMAAILLAVVAGSASAQFKPTPSGHKKFDKAREEMAVVAEMTQSCIEENARVAQDQDEYYERYNSFRKKIIQDYCEFVGDPDRWKSMVATAAVPVPEEKEVEPMFAPGAEEQTASWVGNFFKRKKKNDEFDKTEPKPKPTSQDKPKQPVKPAPLTSDVLPVKQIIQAEPVSEEIKPQVEAKSFESFANDYKPFSVFGTECKVRFGKDCKFTLRSLDPETIADAIKNFTESQYENLLYDCLFRPLAF